MSPRNRDRGAIKEFFPGARYDTPADNERDLMDRLCLGGHLVEGGIGTEHPGPSVLGGGECHHWILAPDGVAQETAIPARLFSQLGQVGGGVASGRF